MEPKSFDIPAINNEKFALMRFLGLEDDDQRMNDEVSDEPGLKAFSLDDRKFLVGRHTNVDPAKAHGRVQYNSSLWSIIETTEVPEAFPQGHQGISKPALTLIDQREISCSFDCMSLFLNGTLIIESEYGSLPIEEIAGNLATALSIELVTHVVTEKEVAAHMAEVNGCFPAFKEAVEEGNDLDEFCQGYANDVLVKIFNL